MTSRIQVVETRSGRAVKVAGRLDSSVVPILGSACARQDGPLRLDLQDLRSVDEDGARLLRRLRDAGAELLDVPPFLLLLLDADDRHQQDGP